MWQYRIYITEQAEGHLSSIKNYYIEQMKKEPPCGSFFMPRQLRAIQNNTTSRTKRVGKNIEFY